MLDTIVREGRLVLRHSVSASELGIRDGRICVIADRIDEPALEEIDASPVRHAQHSRCAHAHLGAQPNRMEVTGTGARPQAAPLFPRYR